MKVISLRPAFPGLAWRSEFAECVIARCPDINPDRADAASDLAYLRFGRDAPSAVAERYAGLHVAHGARAAEQWLREGGDPSQAVA